MISTKDLRDIFDEATKKAGDAIGDAKIPNVSIGRDPTPGFLYFSIGLFFGALAGVVIAFLMTPYTGEQARHKLGEQVDKVRKAAEAETNGYTASAGPTAYSSPSSAHSTPTTASYERS